MKKTYNKPACLVVELSSRNALMSVSSTESLSNTSYGGDASTAGVTSADAKGVSDVNVWDKEW